MIQGDTVIVRKKRRLQDEEEVHVLNTNGVQESTPNLHYKSELDQECRPFSTRDGKAKSNEKINFYIKVNSRDGGETLPACFFMFFLTFVSIDMITVV